MYSVTCRVEFDAAHRLVGHKGACCNLHGHRYVAEVTVCGERLNEFGMVVDFGDIKKEIRDFVDNLWDHNILLNSQDSLAEGVDGDQERKPYIFSEMNPTAEVMARELWRRMSFPVSKVRIYETPDCWAEYESATS